MFKFSYFLSKDHIRTLELARTHLQKPLQISEECLLSREGRRGIDEVKDAVERTLTKVETQYKNAYVWSSQHL